MKVKNKKYCFYSNWQGNELTCACLFHNPCCDRFEKCEEIELELKPYDDIEECLRNQRRYVRHKGALKQK